MSLFSPIEHFDNFPHSESTFGTRLSLFMLACSKGQTKQTFIPLHYGVKTFMKLYLNNLNYIPYARHYKPRLVYFFTPFPMTIYVLWPLALCMACIQERLLIKSGLWWRAYGIWSKVHFYQIMIWFKKFPYFLYWQIFLDRFVTFGCPSRKLRNRHYPNLPVSAL